MISADTQALTAILLDEPQAAGCADALVSSHPVLLSAATLAEALIVAQGREACADGNRCCRAGRIRSAP